MRISDWSSDVCSSDLLSWRDVDLAVVHKRPDTGEHRLRKLTPLSLRLYTARSYLDQHGPITTIADLTPHPFVGYLEFTDFVDTLSGLTKLGIRPQFRSRSEEHTSALQSLMSISYAVFCLKKKTNNIIIR